MSSLALPPGANANASSGSGAGVPSANASGGAGAGAGAAAGAATTPYYAMANPSGAGSSTNANAPLPGQGQQGLKRSVSPQKDSERPMKMQKAKEAFDWRAEEEAARRLNVGRINNTSYAGASRAKRTDLFGPALRERLEAMGKYPRDHNLSFDDESLAYLSLAAESRLRTLLTSSLSAQIHRTSTSHLHPPPLTSPAIKVASSSKHPHPQPLWSVSVQSDDNAVQEALNREAKENEQRFRSDRMDRIAREAELARIRERQAAIASEYAMRDGGTGMAAGGSGSPGGVGAPGGAGAGMTNSTSNEGSPSTPDRPSPSGGNVNTNITPGVNPGTPVFGAVGSTSKKPKGTSKKAVSADVQLKLSNATAMRSVGLKTKQYSWMTSAPNVPSPLGSKGKKAKKDKDKDKDKDKGDEDPSKLETNANTDAKGDEGSAAMAMGNTKEERSEASGGQMGNGNGNGENGEDRKTSGKKRKNPEGRDGNENGSRDARPKRPKQMPSVVQRRMVLIGRNERGEEKRVADDRALTLVDVVFALERDGVGRGMGTAAEVVTKVMSRPGGVWAHDK